MFSMENCIFCKIAKKEISANIIIENENFISFLDIRPLSPGHALVIPKNHYRWVWDVPNVGEYFEFARKVAVAQKMAFNVEQIQSKIVGEEVPHAHVWLIPDPKNIKGNKNDFEGNLKKIKESLE